jgi:Glycine-zipper domain
MNKRLAFLALAGVAALGGCATYPTGPTVMVQPGPSKTSDQYRIDDAACRQYAQTIAAGPGPGTAAADAAAANAVAGTIFGAATGAIIGSASGHAGPGAAIGAGTGLLLGAATSSGAAGYATVAMQRQFDIAYVQCMSARGNGMAARQPARVAAPAYPPPNTPPPSFVAPAPSGTFAVPTYPPAATPPQNTPPPGLTAPPPGGSYGVPTYPPSAPPPTTPPPRM